MRLGFVMSGGRLTDLKEETEQEGRSGILKERRLNSIFTYSMM